MNKEYFNIYDSEAALQAETTIMQTKHQVLIFHAKGIFTVSYSTMLKVKPGFFQIEIITIIIIKNDSDKKLIKKLKLIFFLKMILISIICNFSVYKRNYNV